ncbi:MAG: sugar transferase, partial [Spirochaetaceae bacterium]
MLLDLFVIAASYVLTYIFRDQLIFFGLEELAGFDVYFPYLVVVLIVWMILLR